MNPERQQDAFHVTQRKAAGYDALSVFAGQYLATIGESLCCGILIGSLQNQLTLTDGSSRNEVEIVAAKRSCHLPITQCFTDLKVLSPAP